MSYYGQDGQQYYEDDLVGDGYTQIDTYTDAGPGWSGVKDGGVVHRQQITHTSDRPPQQYGMPAYNPQSYPPPRATYNFNNDQVKGQEDVGDEYAYSDQYVESKAEEQGMFDEDGHLQVRDVYGHQKIIIDAKMRGSREQLAKNPSKTVWRPTPAVLDNFKNNNRMTNRSNATDKDRTGDLRKAIILGVRVLDTYSDYDEDVGLHITGVEPRVITDNSKFAWTIDGKSGSKTVNQPIHQPDNIFTIEMAKDYAKCNSQSLRSQVRFDMGSDTHANVDTTGFVWHVIMNNADRVAEWAQHVDDLYDIEADRRAGNLKSRFAEIPMPIARYVYDSIDEHLKKIEEAFIDFRNFQVSFHTVDGEDWNQCRGLIGEAAAMGKESKQTLMAVALNKPCRVGAKIEIEYIVHE